LPAHGERVVDADSWEASEVAVGGPQLSNTMFKDECGDVGVLGKIAGGLAGAEELLHENSMSRPFAQQVEGWRLK
jgi:hypothetical protein